MYYELEVENYRGPLDKLLELVQEKKLEITLVSLAEVTADFLEYLKKIAAPIEARASRAPSEQENKFEAGLISDFIVIASKLVLIKSKVLLPALPLSDEEEEDVRNLESRLKLYEKIKKAEAGIKDRWSSLPQMRSREFLMGLSAVFYPPKGLTPVMLQKALAALAEEFLKIQTPIKIERRELINFEVKIKEVIEKLTSTPREFRSLGGQNREELIVLFLAVLHLIKERLISASQEKHFSGIQVAKNS